MSRGLRQRRMPAGEMWERGWLPLEAACDALDCTPGDLRRYVRDGAVRRRSIPGTSLYLYEVPQAASR